MGGSGSGNHYHWWRGTKKTAVEWCRSLDISKLVREGYLRGPVSVGTWRWTRHDQTSSSVGFIVDTCPGQPPVLRLSYDWKYPHTEETFHANYSVGLTTTRQRNGGARWWFQCPLARGGQTCLRRVRKLYLPPGARYFGCRQCHHLTYTSCQESHKYDRVFRHLAADMGWEFEDVKWAMNQIGKR